MHGKYNDLIVDGKRAPISFDEAVNIDTGENEADIDTETEGSDEVSILTTNIFIDCCFLWSIGRVLVFPGLFASN